MIKITEEELSFDLDSLKALQEQRKATIANLKESIDKEETVYEERERIMSVLEEEPEQTDIITRDLRVLINEQKRRLENIQTIREAITEEEQAMSHEQDIIKAIETGEGI